MTKISATGNTCVCKYFRRGCSTCRTILTETILNTAYKYSGKVYGEYVREVIVSDKYTESVTNRVNVDLWFTCEDKAKQFRRDIVNNSLILINEDGKWDIKDGHHIEADKWVVEIVNGVSQEDQLFEFINVSITVCPLFPEGCYDVNCLSYDGVKLEAENPTWRNHNGELYEVNHFGKCDDSFKIIGSILTKKALHLEGFHEIVNGQLDRKTDKLLRYKYSIYQFEPKLIEIN